MDLSCGRHGLSGFLHSCFRSLSATFELLFVGTAYVSVGLSVGTFDSMASHEIEYNFIHIYLGVL